MPVYLESGQDAVEYCSVKSEGQHYELRQLTKTHLGPPICSVLMHGGLDRTHIKVAGGVASATAIAWHYWPRLGRV